MLNFKKILVNGKCLTLTMLLSTAHASTQHPSNCVDANIIRTKGLSYVTSYKMDNNYWLAFQLNNYDTVFPWQFMMWGINADNKTVAMEKALDALKQLEIIPDLNQACRDDSKYCTCFYKSNDYRAILISPPVAFDINSQG